MIGDLSKIVRGDSDPIGNGKKKLNIPIYYGVEHTVYDVIVDAIFGIGLTREVEGTYRRAIEAINASKAKIVAVDIPSGVNADDGSIYGMCC